MTSRAKCKIHRLTLTIRALDLRFVKHQVLGSLRLEQETDGRFAFIGYRDQKKEGLRGRDRDAFRCLLEVAWDMAAGGVFVRRFGMESDKKFPR